MKEVKTTRVERKKGTRLIVTVNTSRKVLPRQGRQGASAKSSLEKAPKGKKVRQHWTKDWGRRKGKRQSQPREGMKKSEVEKFHGAITLDSCGDLARLGCPREGPKGETPRNGKML